MPNDGGERLAKQFDKVYNVAEQLREQLIRKAHLQIPQNDRKFDVWLESIATIAKKLRAIRKVEIVLRNKMDAHDTAWDYSQE